MKSEKEKNNKLDYKISKDDIKCQEVETRIRIVSDNCTRKEKWNEKLLLKEQEL